jgi:uncharacterized protein YdaU (DUF1376 family)
MNALRKDGTEAGANLPPAPEQSTGVEPADMPVKNTTKAPAFQFYPKDFISSSKVQRMTLTEIGVYALLLSHCWLDNGLPTSVEKIARLVKIPPPRFRKMWEGPLSECFTERAGRLHNPRLDEERRKQADYRRRQTDNGKLGGRPKKEPTDKPDETQNNPLVTSGFPKTEPTERFPSSSSSSKERTDTQGRGAPIHQSHIKHAACGRVCVPADLHSKFTRALNRDDADKVLRDWYTVVDHDWSVGSRKADNVGGDDYQFWRARFDEKWPAADVAKKSVADSRLPAWAQEAQARKAAQR